MINENKFLEPNEVEEKLQEENKKGSRLISISGDEREGEYFLIYHLDQGEGKTLNLEVKLEDKKAERVTDIFETRLRHLNFSSNRMVSKSLIKINSLEKEKPT